MKYAIFSLLFFLVFSLTAQEEYAIAAGGKTIEFANIGKLTIVGTTDSKMSISKEGNESKSDERAKGLRKISASGKQDNTGYGVSVTETAGVIRVEQVGSKNSRITVSVPNSASVKLESSGHQGGKLEVNDFGGELDVSMQYHRVMLRDATGPVAVNTIYGGITATYTNTPTQNVQLHSSYSDVDLSLPAATKVDVTLSTSYGSMYTDFDMEVKSNTKDGNDHDHDHGHGLLRGKINGGGTLISLTATYDDIYLRKL